MLASTYKNHSVINWKALARLYEQHDPNVAIIRAFASDSWRYMSL